MNRRAVIKLFGKLLFLATPLSSKIVRAALEEETDLSAQKYVLIYDSGLLSSGYKKFLRRISPFLLSRDSEWRAKLDLWDLQADRKKIQAFIDKYGRNTQSFSWPTLVAVPDADETETEVEIWTLDWLKNREAQDMDACYPISGGWWSVEGDWRPTIEKVRNHLFHSPNHMGGKFEWPWLELLKFEELQSLHSDHHREMIRRGRVHWKNVNVECPTNQLV